jgi:hypothetical protein
MDQPSFNINHSLLDDLTKALDKTGGWGSVEIYMQNYKVTQITSRMIKKTNHDLNGKNRLTKDKR